MRIAVFGLGYVGLVTALCHAADGHDVVGVDKDSSKIEKLRRGRAPFSEPTADELLNCAISSGRLSLTDVASVAVKSTDVALICVGTPSASNGSTDLRAVVEASRAIGAALSKLKKRYTVVLRSTVPPGTTRNIVAPTLVRESMRTLGTGLCLYFNPEFLRQGSAVSDFRAPPFVVLGTADGNAPTENADVRSLFGTNDTEQVILNYQEAELLKIACNAFHALKVDFANEIGTVAQHVDANPKRVMSAFVKDRNLNVSPAYLRPGFAFGGSCLPKDVRSLNHIAVSHGLELPVASAILPSNDAHLQRVVSRLTTQDTGTIGVIGLTFKSNTDDLRESPAVALLRKLQELGREVVIYEPELGSRRITESQQKELSEALPGYPITLLDRPEFIHRADTVVITKPGIIAVQELGEEGITVIDAT